VVEQMQQPHSTLVLLLLLNPLHFLLLIVHFDIRQQNFQNYITEPENDIFQDLYL